jgi:hypothetical protein
MGGECCARSTGWKEHRSVAAFRSCLSEPHIPLQPANNLPTTCSGSTSAGYKDPIVYNFKVLASLARQVYIAEKMAPPTNLSAYVNSYANIWSNAVSPNFWKGLAQNGQWAKVGVVVSAGVLRLRSECARAKETDRIRVLSLHPFSAQHTTSVLSLPFSLLHYQ